MKQSRNDNPPGVRVKGRWSCLYRAIDSAGATIDFLLSAFSDPDAAKRLFRKALGDRSHPRPRVINTDLAPICSFAIPDCKKEETAAHPLSTLLLPDHVGRFVALNRSPSRPVQYLNNILEQDHRAIERRVNAKQSFREFQDGWREMIFFDRFGSSTAFSSSQPKNAR